GGPAGDLREKKAPALREITERMLLRNYAPACVAVNEHGEILYVHGRSGKYLELPAGDASLNILKAARDGLKIDLDNGPPKVNAQPQAVRYEGLEVRTNGGFPAVTVPLEMAEGLAGASNVILITFHETPAKAPDELPHPLSETPPESSSPPDEKDRH